MIDEVLLRNVALIREASMAPAPGLTVITGESGSGKTAFLSGLKLLVGERGSAEMVRDGADSLEVQGRFFSARGDDADEGTVVQRTVAADGRSRVRVNGSMATVGDLAQTVGAAVDLCGQHEHQQLMKATSQARMLDDWIGVELAPVLAAYREALDAAAAQRRRHDELLEMGKADSERLDEARFVLSRIDAVSPQPGEYEELLAEARRMENIEDLVRAAGGASEALSGDGGALDGLNAAVQLLQTAAGLDGRFGDSAKALNEACFIVEDAAREVERLVPDADSFDAARLEQVQERLASFQGRIRAYGPTMDEVLARRDAAQQAVDAHENHDELLARSARELEQAEDALAAAAERLSEMRKAHAPRFAADVNALLEQLEMPGAQIACTVERLERVRWSAAGPDHVSFLFKPAAASEPRPLNRIASGGEMSRVTLAVKAVMGRADEVETLVFDEVDAGVGGKTARAVGAVLQRLAQTHQVIVVTHLAQIAALGDVHYVVERVGADVPETRMREVRGFDRTQEVARMLSGSVDNTALVHAEALLRK